jgi:hypothetical protein
MTKTALAVALALAVTPALAQVKDCDELKAEIDTKITNNGVTMFTTTIVDMDAPEDGKVVGTCGGQTKKIVYKRGASPLSEGTPAAPAATTETSTSKQ